MAQARNEINDLAGCRRALSQGNLAPNHYWDKNANKPDPTTGDFAWHSVLMDIKRRNPQTNRVRLL